MKTGFVAFGVFCGVTGCFRGEAAPPAPAPATSAKPSAAVSSAKAAPGTKDLPGVRVTFPVGHLEITRSAALSPDGRFIASADGEGEVILWERATGNEVTRLAQKRVKRLAFSPDGRRLAMTVKFTSISPGVALWDMTTRTRLWEAGTFKQGGEEVNDIAFSPDGTRLAGATDLAKGLEVPTGSVFVWDAATGEAAVKLDVVGKSVKTVAWMPNGTQFVAGCDDGDVLLCDARPTAAARRLFNAGAGLVCDLDVHPDGRRILVGTGIGDATGGGAKSPVRVWSVDGQPLQDFAAPSVNEAARCVRFAEGGKAVVALFGRTTPVHVWESNGALRRTYPYKYFEVTPYGDSVILAEFGLSRDGDVAAFPTGRGVVAVRLSGADTPQYAGRKLPVSSIAYSENGKWGLVGTETGEVRLIEMGTGRNVRRFTDLVGDRVIRAVSLSSDGARACLATSTRVNRATGKSEPGVVVVVETATGSILFRFDKEFSWDYEGYYNVVISADGKTLVGSNRQGQVRGWDVDSGRDLFTSRPAAATQVIDQVAFRPDSRIVAVASSWEVYLLDAQTGQSVRTLKVPAPNQVMNGYLDWSADGKHIVYVREPFDTDFERFFLFDTEAGTARSYAPTLAQNGPEWLGGGVRGFAPTARPEDGFRVPEAVRKASAAFETNRNEPVEWVRRTTLTPDGRFQRVLTEQGSIAVYDVKRGKRVVTLLPIAGAETNPGGEWIAYDESGRFAGSETAMQTVAVVIGPVGSETTLPISRFFERYFAPNLVVAALGKSPGPGSRPITPLPTPNEALKNGSPPLVRLTATASATTPTIEVTVDATEQAKGGVKAIRLYHNGKLVGGPSVLRGIAIEAVSGATTTKKFTIVLENGANQLRAVAYSSTDLESKAAETIVSFTPAAIAKPALYVLSVGINTYKDATMNLAYARPDAESLADLFDSAKGGKSGSGLFAQTHVTRLLDAEATGAAILGGIAALAQNAKPEDVVLVYLAGHGEMADNVWNFLPTEMRQMALTERVKEFGVPWPRIEAAVGKIRARKVVLVVDACKSGGALTGGVRGAAEEQQALAVMARAQGIHILTASTSQQYAGEVKALGHGILTYALLEGLNGKASGTGSTASAAVMVRELMAYVENRVPELSLQYRGEAQYPVPFDRGQNFPVSSRQ